MTIMTIDNLEILGDWMAEVEEWELFEADMATDPYGDAGWADRQELGL